MNEDLRFDILAAYFGEDILMTFTGRDYSCIAQFREKFSTCGSMHRHLRGSVYHCVGNGTADDLRTSPVLNDESVHTDRSGIFYVIAEMFCFAVGNNGIYSKIQLSAVLMAQLCGIRQFLIREV